MTVDIGEKTLKKWDGIFSKQNRKVALITDNCTANCIVDLKFIKLVFLSPNSTCVFISFRSRHNPKYQDYL